MLVRLTKATRLKAGRILALAYLLCVLAPSASFAFGEGARAAPCLIGDVHGKGLAHVHENASPRHSEKNEHSHARATEAIHDHGVSEPAQAQANEVAAALSSDDAAGDHHKSGGQCCGLMCVTALPAVILDIGQPAAPECIYVFTTYRNVADSAPPRHYRPPIS